MTPLQAGYTRRVKAIGTPGAATQAGRQRGLTLISTLVVLSVVVFLGLFAFRIGPHYVEYWTIKKVAEQLAQSPEVLSQPKSRVEQFVNQGFRQNNLWDRKAEDTIHLVKDGKRGLLVRVDYENRVNLFSNVDVVTSFKSDILPH